MQYRSVTVLAPAKLNLSLDVVGTLPNGYHDLDMVMQTIDLYEKITLRRSHDLTLNLPGSFVPANDKNTAVKAALAFFAYTGLLAGVDMTIYKRVPVRAGMAGGSADAAGVLVGLNELYGAKLSMSELCAIGAGIGADVPFALMGGTCRVRGVGDLMKALPPCPDCWFVVAIPPPKPLPAMTQWAALSPLTARHRSRPSATTTCPASARRPAMRSSIAPVRTKRPPSAKRCGRRGP